jgi:hypothetical protein
MVVGVWVARVRKTTYDLGIKVSGQRNGLMGAWVSTAW